MGPDSNAFRIRKDGRRIGEIAGWNLRRAARSLSFRTKIRQSIMPRAAQAFAAVRFVFSIQAAKSNASLPSTRRIENCDAIHPDKYMASRREAYRAIARPSARFAASANFLPV